MIDAILNENVVTSVESGRARTMLQKAAECAGTSEEAMSAALAVIRDAREHQMEAVDCGIGKRPETYRAAWREGYGRMINSILTERAMH
jgi:hypothetical protein